MPHLLFLFTWETKHIFFKKNILYDINSLKFVNLYIVKIFDIFSLICIDYLNCLLWVCLTIHSNFSFYSAQIKVSLHSLNASSRHFQYKAISETDSYCVRWIDISRFLELERLHWRLHFLSISAHSTSTNSSLLYTGNVKKGASEFDACRVS
jgi:hypothetical protein